MSENENGTVSASVSGAPKIFAAMAGIMADIEAVKKSRENQMQRFKFRGVDDVMNALHPLFAKHRVFILPEILETFDVEERETKGGGRMIYRRYKIAFHFVSGEDGSKVTATVIGEASDTSDKATNKCFSIAYKYAMLQTFAIPTEDIEDPDKVSYEIGGKAGKPFAPPANEGAAIHNSLMSEIRELLNVKTPDGGLYFTQEEKNGYSVKAKQTGSYAQGIAILEQMKAGIAGTLERRKTEYLAKTAGETA